MAAGDAGDQGRGGVFISYRRQDTEGWAGRLFDRLKDALEPLPVFLDSDIEPGEEFPDRLRGELASADIVLVVIGAQWLTELENRQASGEYDYVVEEIQTALSQDALVIPVIFKDAVIPREDDLPSEIAGLAKKNVLNIRGSQFSTDVDVLIDKIRSRKKGQRIDELAEERSTSRVLGPRDWKKLLRNLEDGEVVPVLGAGARALPPQKNPEQEQHKALQADAETIPTQLLGADVDLPRLAQAISVLDGPAQPSKTLKRMARSREPVKDDVLTAFATLPVPVFLTTLFDEDLELALKSENKDPRSVEPLSAGERDAAGGDAANAPLSLDPDAPLVFHVFGRYSTDRALILSEDDFFDLFIRIQAQDFFDETVLEHLGISSLLFFGFRLDDWRFRLLLRGLALQLDNNDQQNIAVVQLERSDLPEEHDEETVTEFVEEYFSSSAINIKAFVGTAEEFAAALQERAP